MPKNTKPTNIQAAREAKSADVIAAANKAEAENIKLPASLVEADQELAAAFGPGPHNDLEAEATAKDAAEAQGMGQVQVSMEEVFQIIGAQEYELRALRQRIPVLIQQVITLKGVVRRLEAAKKS